MAALAEEKLPAKWRFGSLWEKVVYFFIFCFDSYKWSQLCNFCSNYTRFFTVVLNMADRNLMHYFNLNPSKPCSTTSPEAESEKQGLVTLNETCDESVETVGRRRRTAGSKAKYVQEKDSDDDFENDPIMPPLNGNSITKYFSPVDKVAIARKTKVKSSVMTVQAQVHGSPQKVPKLVLKKVTCKKKKKKKVGISGSQADVIEFVSSEELPVGNSDILTTHSTEQLESMCTPTVLTISNTSFKTSDSSVSMKPSINKTNWTMKICLGENIKSSDNGMCNF